MKISIYTDASFTLFKVQGAFVIITKDMYIEKTFKLKAATSNDAEFDCVREALLHILCSNICKHKTSVIINLFTDSKNVINELNGNTEKTKEVLWFKQALLDKFDLKELTICGHYTPRKNISYIDKLSKIPYTFYRRICGKYKNTKERSN